MDHTRPLVVYFFSFPQCNDKLDVASHVIVRTNQTAFWYFKNIHKKYLSPNLLIAEGIFLAV